MGKKRHKTRSRPHICVEVVNIATRKVKKINLEEKRVFFDIETDTYQEVKTNKSSNYDNEPRKNTKKAKVLPN